VDRCEYECQHLHGQRLLCIKTARHAGNHTVYP
jgi:hypothetical protein